VLVAKGDFTSLTWPLAAQAAHGVVVTEADLTELADPAADGALADLESLAAATAGIRTRVLIDVTQAAGWLLLSLDWADAVVGASYK
jgi:hypothetical protein